jgi:hypothetical protein
MELTPLGTLTLELASDRLFMLGSTPVGNRIIQEIAAVRFEGERLKANMKGAAAADWLAVDSTGIATFDIRLLLETDDDALIYMSYFGKADWSKGMGNGPVYVTAHFETGDDRYRWLNHAGVAGKGEVRPPGGIVYEFCQVI